MQSASDSESNLGLIQEDRKGSWTRRVGAAVAAGAVLLLAPAAVHFSHQQGDTASVVDLVGEYNIDLVPKRGDCAEVTHNCISAKCCATSGMKCFRKDAYYAQCKKACPGGGWSCFEEKPLWSQKSVVKSLDTSLFCFSVYMKNRGKDLVNTNDLLILKKAFQYQESIFTCNDWEVFSDEPAQIADKIWSTTVSDPNGQFKAFFRKDKPDHYLNTPLFLQVWKALAQQKRYARQSFTVKVDPVTVFFPQKLRNWLVAGKLGETDNGFYFENCKSVKQGFFGNLEVVSKAAMDIFQSRADECTASCWKEDTPECIKKWKFGPWGEDLFMQNCMDKFGVSKQSDFTMDADGMCKKNHPTFRKSSDGGYTPYCKNSKQIVYHPFRKPADYFKCLAETQDLA